MTVQVPNPAVVLQVCFQSRVKLHAPHRRRRGWALFVCVRVFTRFALGARVWCCFLRPSLHLSVQFEDFRTEYASKLLERYRYQHLCFNDDIQVTSPLGFVSS